MGRRGGLFGVGRPRPFARPGGSGPIGPGRSWRTPPAARSDCGRNLPRAILRKPPNVVHEPRTTATRPTSRKGGRLATRRPVPWSAAAQMTRPGSAAASSRTLIITRRWDFLPVPTDGLRQDELLLIWFPHSDRFDNESE